MYLILHCLAFGPSSVVLSYNRDPELVVNGCRCLFKMPRTHFYDDRLTCDVSTAKGSGQKSYVRLAGLLGKQADADKHANVGPDLTFTGCPRSCAEALLNGRFGIVPPPPPTPKPGRFERVQGFVDRVAHLPKLPCCEANVFSLAVNYKERCCVCDSALVERQYRCDQAHHLSARLTASLLFIKEAFARSPVCHKVSDAAYEAGFVPGQLPAPWQWCRPTGHCRSVPEAPLPDLYR